MIKYIQFLYKVRTTILLLILCTASLNAVGQFVPDREQKQVIATQDSTQNSEAVELPDSVVLRKYNPYFPTTQVGISDSILNLDAVRFDPVSKLGPDFVALNGVVLPASSAIILGNSYQRNKQLLQDEHPAYQAKPAPFFAQNIPFSFVAYNQGGEIDDGQARVLLGRTFAKGWSLSFEYNRTYQSAEDNVYPLAGGDRVYLGASIAYVPDSSRHRAYASLVLSSRAYFNPGGYRFDLDNNIETPEESFLAEPLLNTVLETNGKTRRYSYLHRVFLKPQKDSVAKGFSTSFDLNYETKEIRTSGQFSAASFEADSAFFGAFSVDPRGLRHQLNSKTILGGANLEYFTSKNAKLDFTFQAGLYGGNQQFESNYTATPINLLLLGIQGQIQGTVFNKFILNAELDLPLADRAGEGLVKGNLAWKLNDKLSFSGDVLLERSTAPLGVENMGVNNQLLFENDLPSSTHSQWGGTVRYKPLNIRAKGYIDLFTNPIIYREFGLPESINSTIAIPTLSFELPLRYKAFSFVSKSIIRNPPTAAEIRVPAYSGQHSLFATTRVFKNNMELMIGFDGIVRSPLERYSFFPLTQTFYLGEDPQAMDWQYNLDFFLGFKVASFKGFIRLDRILNSTTPNLPSTVEGYPIIKAEGLIPGGSVLRLGASFFLFN